MGGDQPQGAWQEHAARLLVRPWGGAGGVRQWNEIEPVARIFGGEGPSDDRVELLARHELLDGKLADRDDQAGLQEGHLRFQPAGAVGDFAGVGDTVAAGGFFPRKATAY